MLRTFVLAVLLASVPGATVAVTLPELPRTRVDVTAQNPTGRIWSVPAGGNLQAAIDSAASGDVIELAAGATYTGNFMLRAKGGTGWITIRSSAHASLPPGRITPASASLLPKIVTPNVMAVFDTESGAARWRLVGLEIATKPGQWAYNLVYLEGRPVPSSDIVIDRCWIHAWPDGANIRRGVAMNNVRSAVINSYISDIKDWSDAQAIAGWNGPGPYRIENNYLEATGENIMFGGSAPDNPSTIPADIEIRGNHLYKPLRWKAGSPEYAGHSWTIKNLFELKSATRVLFDGNVLENNWVAQQNGFGILFNFEFGISDVTFTNNRMRDSAAGFNIMAGSGNFGPLARILIRNNVFERINDKAFQLLNAGQDITIENNVAMQAGMAIMFDGPSLVRLNFRNNIVMHNDYGAFGSGTGTGNSAFTAYAPPSTDLATRITGNLWINNKGIGNLANSYPAGNLFPSSVADVGFRNAAGGDYGLASTSAYLGRGFGGANPGVDTAALSAATANAVTGGATTPTTPTTPTPPTTTTDTIKPTVVITSPAPGPVARIFTLAANVTDNVGVASVRFRINHMDYGPVLTGPPYSIQVDAWNWRLAAGNWTMHVIARDAAGNETISSVVVQFGTGLEAPTGTTTTTPTTPTTPTTTTDTIKPTVVITSPAPGPVARIFTLSANVTDNVRVASVRFRVNSMDYGPVLTAPPYSIQVDAWNWRLAAGNWTMHVIARDAAGNESIASVVVQFGTGFEAPTGTTSPTSTTDTIKPTVVITSPAPGPVARIFTLSANVTDNVRVASVRFRVNHMDYGPVLTAPPYAIQVDAWNWRLAPGDWTMHVIARDAAGNETISSVVVRFGTGFAAPL